MVTLRWHVEEGDCLAALAKLPDGCVDAVVTDPPAAIAFMGKNFDTFGSDAAFVSWLARILAECLRVLKPGGHALVWGLPRTSYLTGSAVAQAGFKVRDRIVHVFGRGWPKAAGVLKPAAEDWWIGRKGDRGGLRVRECDVSTNGARPRRVSDPERPVIGAALEGRRAAEHNLGGSHAEGTTSEGRRTANIVLSHAPGCRRSGAGVPAGRVYGDETVEAWECVPGCGVAALDAASGERVCGSGAVRRAASREAGYRPAACIGAESRPAGGLQVSYPDAGGASRFFNTFPADDDPSDDCTLVYAGKAPTSERWGLCRACDRTMPAKELRSDAHAPEASGHGKDSRVEHPTCKGLALMRHLVRLACVPGGIVLDPMCGSGSTGVACLLEGVRFLGMEAAPEYARIARARLAATEADAPIGDG